MPVKPDIEDTRWAVSAAGVESTQVSEPDSDLKDSGYDSTGDDSIPLSTDWNWWHRKAHGWFQYLDQLLSDDGAGGTRLSDSLTVGEQLFPFSSRTFTGDATANTLVMAAHPFTTGDGPVRLTTTGTLPPPLATGTDYWLVYAFADQVRVATSLDHALDQSGITVDLTGAGSGTHTIVSTGSTRRREDALVTRNTNVQGQLIVLQNATLLKDLNLNGAITAGGAITGTALSGTTLSLSGAATVNSLAAATTVASPSHTGATATLTGLATVGSLNAGAGAVVLDSTGVTYAGSADEHHPDREFSVDCSDFQDDFAEDGTQGVLQRQTIFSVIGVFRSFFVGGANGTGELGLCVGLDRIRVGDKITTIEVCFAQLNTPNGLEVLQLFANGHTTASDNAVFTSATLTRPGSNTIASQVVTVNYVHVTGTGLRLRIKTTNTNSGGTMYLRWVIVKFLRT